MTLHFWTQRGEIVSRDRPNKDRVKVTQIALPTDNLVEDNSSGDIPIPRTLPRGETPDIKRIAIRVKGEREGMRHDIDYVEYSRDK